MLASRSRWCWPRSSASSSPVRSRKVRRRTDLVLTVTRCCARRASSAASFEFYGPGVGALALADRATIGNMAPEYGATCGFFPVDKETLRYLGFTGRDPARVSWSRPMQGARPVARRTPRRPRLHRHAVARPLHRRALACRSASGRRTAAPSPASANPSRRAAQARGRPRRRDARQAGQGRRRQLPDQGRATSSSPAITSCTNTSIQRHAGGPASSPAMGEEGSQGQAVGQDLAGGRAARWSPTITRRPGCRRTSTRSASISSLWLHHLHRPIPARCPSTSRRRRRGNLVVAAVLSGNRNFEGRISPQVAPTISPRRRSSSLCHRRLDECRSRTDSRATIRTASRLSPGHLALEPRRSGDARQEPDARDVPQALRQRLRGSGGVAQGRDRHRHDFKWQAASTYVRPRAFSRTCRKEPEAVKDIHQGATPPSSATASPPTTSRRRAASRRTARGQTT